jgi:serine/threonine-protein kinase RsbW
MEDRFERLSLPASLPSLRPLLAFAHAGAKGAGLKAVEIDQLDLILEEILVNIARYAYAPGDGDVELAYAPVGSGTLMLEISDKGRSFNPLETTDPDISSDLAHRAVGGWGVFLVKHLAGSLVYRREQDRNILSFRFPVSPGT